MKIKILVMSLLFCFFLDNATAGVSLKKIENEVVLEDEILGVEVKFDATGNLVSAVSSYSHVVEISDRRGINKAYLVAEEKAKAQLIRFISQDIATSRVVEQLDNSVEITSRTSGKSEENLKKFNSREVKEAINELSSSTAKGTLRGVRILSRSYDSNTEEVTVVVGINHKSKSAANSLGDSANEKNIQNSENNSGKNTSSKSESKKSRDLNEFR